MSNELEDLLGPEYLTAFAEILERVLKVGYGRIGFVIRKSRIRFLEVTFSIPLSPSGWTGLTADQEAIIEWLEANNTD